MEFPAQASGYTTRMSKKTASRTASSSLWGNDVEVFETLPGDFGSSKPKLFKRKEVRRHEIISIDSEEDTDDEPPYKTYLDAFEKGKKTKQKYLPGETSSIEKAGGVMLTTENGVSGSHDSSVVDDTSSLNFFKEDEWMDNHYEDIPSDDDDYAKWILSLENINAPTGIELDFPLFTNSSGKLQIQEASSEMKIGPHSSFDTFSDAQMMAPMPFPEVPNASSKMKIGPKSSSNASSGVQGMVPMTAPFAKIPEVSSQMKTGFQTLGSAFSGVQKVEPMTPPSQSLAGKVSKMLHKHFDADTKIKYAKPYLNHSESRSQVAFQNWVQKSLKSMNEESSCGTSPSTITESQNMDCPGGFKKFATVEDCSDHHFKRETAKLKPKQWAKRIQEEWKILQNDLPEKIFVRAYESRMELLRAAIIGAEGTPYHDGLFFFDVLFTDDYPNSPPVVHYHSSGLRINPNLYADGKVCLSLLHTWSGDQQEKWIPGVSTMLQVLVSIQALVLNAKPYFNEPGYAFSEGSPNGEQSSLAYNENTFVYSLKTMVYSMQRPPQHFEELVVAHFRERAHQVLLSCKAYLEGAHVGSIVEGGIQDVDEGNKGCSMHFKTSLSKYLQTLLSSFMRIGVRDCEQFMNLSLRTVGIKPQQQMETRAQQNTTSG